MESKQTTYDRIYNEGGEGYNPYKDKAEDKEESEEPLWSILEAKRDTLERRMRGTLKPDIYSALQAELMSLENDIKNAWDNWENEVMK